MAVELFRFVASLVYTTKFDTEQKLAEYSIWLENSQMRTAVKSEGFIYISFSDRLRILKPFRSHSWVFESLLARHE